MRRQKRLDATDRGAVTAEFAVALPAVVLALAAALWGLAAAGATMRCVDAARSGARAAARGDPPAAVEAAVRSAAPRGAEVRVSRDGGLVAVVVRARVGPPGTVLGGLPGLEVQGRAVAAAEFSVPVAGG